MVDVPAKNQLEGLLYRHGDTDLQSGDGQASARGPCSFGAFKLCAFAGFLLHVIGRKCV